MFVYFKKQTEFWAIGSNLAQFKTATIELVGTDTVSEIVQYLHIFNLYNSFLNQSLHNSLKEVHFSLKKDIY